MTLDEIRHELATARDIPKAAVKAAVERAEALVPDVLRLMELASRNVVLTRPEERLLFYGVHALAAARRTELYEPLLALIAQRSKDLEWLLYDAPLHPLLISSYAPGSRVPWELLANPKIEDNARSDLFLLLAWLVRQGHVPRAEFVAFLDRFDRDEPSGGNDMAWFGFQGAIALLGLAEFEERVRAGWESGRMPYDREVDRKAWVEDLHRAVRDPADGTDFAHYSAAPIEDIFVALRSMGFFGFGRITSADEPDAGDPARDIRLASDEEAWLESFLDSESAPAAAMSLECADGFLTAVAIGPQEVPVETWWPQIWGAEGNETLSFRTEPLERYLRELYGRRLETIQRRVKAGYRHSPKVHEDSPLELAADWSIGFSIGADLLKDAWRPISENQDASLAVAAIAMLMPEGELPADHPLLKRRNEDALRGVLGNLPHIIQMIHRFWRGLPVPPLFGPRRSQKIGRNEPCPCGSGRKYKKCCGANAPN
jgi:uncharacterized protein